MATATSNSASDIDLDALIQSLPACKRCREHRRGCDTLLPKCRQCSKAGAECVFFDHGKDEYLPRTYIAKLVHHVRELSSPNNNPSPTLSGTTAYDSYSHASSSTAMADSTSSEHQHFDHHFAKAGGDFRYLGAQSCLVKSPRLQQAVIRTPVIPEDDGFELSLSASNPSSYYSLVQTYLNVIQPLYPIIDLSSRFLTLEVPPDLNSIETFALNMIYSIACYLEPDINRNVNFEPHGKLDYHHRASDRYRCLAATFFDRAMEHLEASTLEPSIATLRAVLLLAINSLFDPKSGNIGQQVALATRLALSLEAKSDAQELGPEDSVMIRNMNSTIFCIENDIASTLDRPATFPEPEGDINFNEENPAEFLCSLYRLQHRFRKGDQSVKDLLPRFDERHKLRPTLCLPLHQTHLLLNPCWGSAWYVLEAAVCVGSMHVFLTPHWVYRAGCVLIQNMGSIWVENLVQLYANALVVLELSSAKWPSTGGLKDSLMGLMEHTKSKCRPAWENKHTHFDVRI
ncbi:hypothetical protein B0J11DRAFT_94821 [Dendryphion nanum]|uniref:Zn(2)-C6 fungal-type domain-containing protein n=1 Tax=Dendryphion nanum TaxID=256645 RepID=A0A9P9IDQ1_9PLEO|nr:hypothetical protein B0J11DRAFT_94821 [Dendryphion nanum]